ncbi:MAG: nucleoside monophosphate kinase [Candidatus Woesearchaeota archaeon]|nr:nucleoside monophosphate kinase [Candidatus Woesearchaeota archaeon]
MEKKEKMKIILIGMQGSGKGTYAKLLNEIYHLEHISIGDILRNEVNKKSKIGLQIDEILKKGELVDDKIILDLLENKLKNNFVLDGFPRTIKQARELEKITKIDKVFYITLKDETAIKRLTTRIQCEKCGAIYGNRKKPLNDNICDICGSKLIKRPDDNEESIKKRLEIFHKETKPLIDFYIKKKILIKIVGEKTIDKVFSKIEEYLNK